MILSLEGIFLSNSITVEAMHESKGLDSSKEALKQEMGEERETEEQEVGEEVRQSQ